MACIRWCLSHLTCSSVRKRIRVGVQGLDRVIFNLINLLSEIIAEEGKEKKKKKKESSSINSLKLKDEIIVFLKRLKLNRVNFQN
jgi:hypothetical protein